MRDTEARRTSSSRSGIGPSDTGFGKPIGVQSTCINPNHIVVRQDGHIKCERGLRGGVLGDNCGLGKTVVMLVAIALMAARVEGPYKPTLWLAPAQTMEVGVSEVKQRFQGIITLKLYHRRKKETSDPARKDMIIEPDQLGDYLENLDPTDPATARIVIMTTYNTLLRRTLVHSGKSKSKHPLVTAVAFTAVTSTPLYYPSLKTHWSPRYSWAVV
ncbi:hypothetical protein FQN54_002781 [Arachnomyces sp. PD_36]|nr:hypothetical protein FQN54_002781 [Arachnomyces sp. PD_36]